MSDHQASHERMAIWNRAVLEGGGANPLEGDKMLAAMMFAHGLVMNGGVLHAIEFMSGDQLREAREGYQYFGVLHHDPDDGRTPVHRPVQSMSDGAWGIDADSL